MHRLCPSFFPLGVEQAAPLLLSWIYEIGYPYCRSARPSRSGMLQWSLGYVPAALDVKVLVPDVLDSMEFALGPADYTEICQCGGGQIVLWHMKFLPYHINTKEVLLSSTKSETRGKGKADVPHTKLTGGPLAKNATAVRQDEGETETTTWQHTDRHESTSTRLVILVTRG